MGTYTSYSIGEDLITCKLWSNLVNRSSIRFRSVSVHFLPDFLVSWTSFFNFTYKLSHCASIFAVSGAPFLYCSTGRELAQQSSTIAWAAQNWWERVNLERVNSNWKILMVVSSFVVVHSFLAVVSIHIFLSSKWPSRSLELSPLTTLLTAIRSIDYKFLSCLGTWAMLPQLD